MWRIWAKALGQKEGKTDAEADKIATIRMLIVGVKSRLLLLTQLFISIWRNWALICLMSALT